MRIEELDRVRGAAIMIMVGDHLLGLAGELLPSAWWLVPRLTLTRVALPLFLLLAGALLAGRCPRGGRVVEVLAAGVLVSQLVVAGWLPWMAPLDILVSIGCGLLLWPWIRGSGWFGVVVCMVLAATFPAASLGYHPAYIVGMMLVGTVVGLGPLYRLGERLPRWCAWPGRHPLGWYVGHLGVLACVWAVISSTDSPGRSLGAGGLPEERAATPEDGSAVLDAPRTDPLQLVVGDNTPNGART